MFCLHNPTRWSDPTGLDIRINTRDQGEIDTVLGLLQQLTDHTLGMDGSSVVITSFATNITRPSGNELLERLLVNSTGVVIIQLSALRNSISGWQGSRNYFNGVGVDRLTINLNLTHTVRNYTLNASTGFFSMQDVPLYIVLAHELIHAERIQRGGAISTRRTATLNVPTGEVTRFFIHPSFHSWTSTTYTTIRGVLREEFATIGIDFYRPGDITENQIRQEQGIPISGGGYW